GQTILIPGFKAISHSIQEGESLFLLAEKLSVPPDAVRLLNQNGHNVRLQPGHRLTLPVRTDYLMDESRRPYDFFQMTEMINHLTAIYPFIRKTIAGHSVLGQPLVEISLGAGTRKVHMNASFHANEWITTSVLMTFFADYLNALVNGTSLNGIPALNLYMESTLSIIPMVNPDGVNLVLNGPPETEKSQLIGLNGGSTDFSGWKANIRGVDLNKQFPANWDFETKRLSKMPGPRDFPGFSPLTEPETEAMARLACTEKFDRLLALHTQGNEIYWGYQGLEPAESHTLAREFQKESGYEAVRYVDSFVGFKDWFIQEFRKPGFTLELGKGKNPLPFSQFDQIYGEAIGILVRALY
ncbi:MAG TPA: M14 family metallocarboxypeptidase, partial [Bacillaceae bacterium]